MVQNYNSALTLHTSSFGDLHLPVASYLNWGLVLQGIPPIKATIEFDPET